MRHPIHMKALVVFLLVFVLASSVAVSLALAASPIYVRPSGDDTNCNGTADVDYPGGTGPLACAVRTIQKGIDLVDPGGTISVAAGTYIENVVVNKSLTLAGAGAGSTIVQPAVSNPNCGGAGGGSLCTGGSNLFLVQADNVIIHDLTVDGDNPALIGGFDKGGANIDARNGIITNHAAGIYNGLEVYNVTVKNIYLRGMYASSGGTFNFHNNTITNVQADAASIAMFAYGGGPGIMANNAVSYANDAISANHSKGIQFLNNIVTHSSSGIHTDNSGDGGGVADLIQGNNVDCTGTPDAYGIFVFVPYVAPTVNNNTITSCAYGLSAWGTGAAVTTQFTNNTVTGNLAPGGVGVYITTDEISWGYSDVSVNFSGNVIAGYATGVHLTADQQLWNTYPYVAKTVNATFHLNQIDGNTTGVTKGTAGTYVTDFARNWWGTVDASGVAAAASGGVDYQPWCNADFSRCSYYAPGTISMQTSGSPAEVGEIVTMDSQVTVDGVYGMQLRVSFDPTGLEFQTTGSSHNDVSVASWYWDQAVENFVAVSGGRRLSGTMQDPPHVNPATLTGQSVATWKFKCLKPGIFNLTYDASAGTGTYLATKDGFNIPVTLQNTTVTCLAPTASLDGYIKLQGRLGTNPPAGWNDASVTLTCASTGCNGYGPYTLTTDGTGHYQLAKTTPGSGIVLGTYSAAVARRAYLGAAKATNVTIGAGSNTVNVVGTAPTLLGGDVTGDQAVRIGDLSAIGGAFGTSVTPDTGNDVNGDSFVNIFDLVMAGGNFDKTASVWTP